MARLVHRTLTCVVLLGCGEAGSDEPLECVDEAPIPTSGMEAAVSLFGFDPGDMCGANIEAVGSHAAWVASRWGAPLPLVEYHLYDSSHQHPCWPCPSFASACAGDGVLNTTRIPDLHEIAHASHGPVCPALIEEGLATLYASPFEDSIIFGNYVDALAGILTNGYLAGDYYPYAANFVAFLIDRWGMETVIELCGYPMSTFDEYDHAIEQVLGMTAFELDTQLETYPTWSLGQIRQDQACEGEMEATTAPANLTFELGCDGDHVRGKNKVRTWTHALVELPESGDYTFSFKSEIDFEVDVEMRSCAREGMVSIKYERDKVAISSHVPVEVKKLQFDAGVYVVRVMANAEDFVAGPNPTVELTVGKTP